MNQISQYILTFIFFFITFTYGDVITLPLKKQAKKNTNNRLSGNFLAEATDAKDLSLTGKTENSVYTVEITLGKQEKTFDILIDTGSQIFWVTSTTCEQCKQHYQNSYTCDQTDSCAINANTEQQTLKFGDGTTVIGSVGLVPMKLGEFVIEKQPFILVTQAQDVKSGGEDGIIGLGLFDETSPNQKNWVQQLFEQKKITKESFSIYYDFDNKSALTVGGYNKDFIKDSKPLTYHTVSDDKEWTVTTTKMTFGDATTQDGTNIKTLVDSGTSAISLPQSLFQQIQNFLQTKFQAQMHQEKILVVDCSKADQLPDLVFTIPDEQKKDVQYAIPPSFYLYEEEGQCAVLITTGFSEDKIILGAVFFRKYLSVFEYNPNKIGFAESITEPQSFGNDSSSSSKLPVYAIVIIIVGGILILSIIAFVVVKYLKKRKQKSKKQPAETVPFIAA